MHCCCCRRLHYCLVCVYLSLGRCIGLQRLNLFVICFYFFPLVTYYHYYFYDLNYQVSGGNHICLSLTCSLAILVHCLL
jgi:hypothetical protein